MAQAKVPVPMLLAPAGAGPLEGDTILMVQMTFRVVIGERLGLKVIDDGFAAETYAAARTPMLVWVKAALALAGMLLIPAAAKLAGAGFWRTGLHAAATTFIIPFAFVFNPELMAFPDISWKMVGAFVEVVIVQWTSSVFLYGYFRRSFGPIERFVSFVVVLLGYTAIMRPEPLWTYLALGATIGLMAWVWAFPRTSAPVQAER